MDENILKNYYSAVFLDRDGTINRDVPYCSQPEDFELLPNVGKAIRQLNESGFKVVVITNQSGIGRGYFTEDMLHRIHEKMKQDLALNGAYLDAIYYCPHHPDVVCDCRKPEPGLILRAAKDLNLDIKRSYFVGDKVSDMLAGRRSGCYVLGIVSNGDVEDNELKKFSNYIYNNLYEAVQKIICSNSKI